MGLLVERQVTESKLLTAALDCRACRPCDLCPTGFNYVSQELPIVALGAKGLFIQRVPRNKHGLGSRREGMGVDHSPLGSSVCRVQIRWLLITQPLDLSKLLS